jgi:unsaturated chondroitin disaccharide hydrolase
VLKVKFREALERLRENALSTLSESNGRFPIYKEREWKMSDGRHWMEPFWCGLLWNLSYFFNDGSLMVRAKECSIALSSKEDLSTHDRGFKYYYSTVKGWEITGETKLKELSIKAVQGLAEMFNPSLGFIPLGNDFSSYFPGEPQDTANREFIVDTMMASLPLILWGFSQTGRQDLLYISLIHSHKTFDLLIREDWSTYQAVRVESSGEVYKHTHQGFNNESCWSRGQAWAIHGFAILYNYTKMEFFLKVAENLSNYFIRNLPPDLVPYYDFNDPSIPNALRDTSSSAIVSSALFDIYNYTGDEKYIRKATEMVRSLISEDYFVDGGLKHSRYRQDEAKDAELIFGDYYLSEALIKAMKWGIEG